LKNIKFKKIYTNSKTVFYFLYNNVEIDNLEVEDLKCVGDIDNSSFILFDSGESEKLFNINNMNIKNSVSNGSFIKIRGYSNIINIKNSVIENVQSSGSIIENESKNVYRSY